MRITVGRNITCFRSYLNAPSNIGFTGRILAFFDRAVAKQECLSVVDWKDDVYHPKMSLSIVLEHMPVCPGWLRDKVENLKKSPCWIDEGDDGDDDDPGGDSGIVIEDDDDDDDEGDDNDDNNDDSSAILAQKGGDVIVACGSSNCKVKGEKFKINLELNNALKQLELKILQSAGCQVKVVHAYGAFARDFWKDQVSQKTVKVFQKESLDFWKEWPQSTVPCPADELEIKVFPHPATLVYRPNLMACLESEDGYVQRNMLDTIKLLVHRMLQSASFYGVTGSALYGKLEEAVKEHEAKRDGVINENNLKLVERDTVINENNLKLKEARQNQKGKKKKPKLELAEIPKLELAEIPRTFRWLIPVLKWEDLGKISLSPSLLKKPFLFDKWGIKLNQKHVPRAETVEVLQSSNAKEFGNLAKGPEWIEQSKKVCYFY